ncbi:MAG: hypothetical protein KBD01_03100 [Acidobacteria bacterium]|nr:hypothetical protein [Acidobacteriota bacterium]
MNTTGQRDLEAFAERFFERQRREILGRVAAERRSRRRRGRRAAGLAAAALLVTAFLLGVLQNPPAPDPPLSAGWLFDWEFPADAVTADPLAPFGAFGDAADEQGDDDPDAWVDPPLVLGSVNMVTHRAPDAAAAECHRVHGTEHLG